MERDTKTEKKSKRTGTPPNPFYTPIDNGSSQKSLEMVEVYHLKEKGPALVRGRSVGEKIAHGPVRVVKSAHNLNEVQKGDVLVTDKTDPDWEPTMKKAAAIVTNRGGRTCHAAIVSRELGLPAIVGTENATEVLKDGQAVTVSCAEGETGFVYQGLLKFDVQQIKVHDLPRPQTKVMMNVGNPEEAFRLSFMPNDGVGLAREEFIISNYIKIHPLALIDFDRLEDRALREQFFSSRSAMKTNLSSSSTSWLKVLP